MPNILSPQEKEVKLLPLSSDEFNALKNNPQSHIFQMVIALQNDQEDREIILSMIYRLWNILATEKQKFIEDNLEKYKRESDEYRRSWAEYCRERAKALLDSLQQMSTNGITSIKILFNILFKTVQTSAQVLSDMVSTALGGSTGTVQINDKTLVVPTGPIPPALVLPALVLPGGGVLPAGAVPVAATPAAPVPTAPAPSVSNDEMARTVCRQTYRRRYRQRMEAENPNIRLTSPERVELDSKIEKVFLDNLPIRLAEDNYIDDCMRLLQNYRMLIGPCYFYNEDASLYKNITLFTGRDSSSSYHSEGEYKEFKYTPPGYS